MCRRAAPSVRALVYKTGDLTDRQMERLSTMCGIAGWLGATDGDEAMAQRMAQALRHRGPDAQGIKSWPNASLVHTRLSIIDLSPAGAQPMANEDGTVWTIFNGEIYNHRELRRKLEDQGHIFRGHSDTEVLPHLYEEEGLEFVARLRGMFTLAIYDQKTRTLILARDRFGIKPLFYAPSNDRIAFASEINPLLNLPGIDDSPDKQAIYDFAALFYIPAPETLYKGIRALEPGELLEARIESERIIWRTQNFHRWAINPDRSLTLDEAADRSDALLSEAVSSQMESDVPLGAFLSGGIDSSLVSAAAQTALDGGIRTFNVRFPDKDYDETWAALAVAKHIGSRHETLDMDDVEGSWDHITQLLLHAGQPFADTSLFAANAVCRRMRQHVTVALSGDGGDEGFGGYDLYSRLDPIAQLQRLPVPFRRAVWHGAASAMWPLARVGIVPVHHPQRARDMAGADQTSVIQNLFCPLHEGEQRNLCLDMDVLPVRRLFEPQWEDRLPKTASRLERLSAHAAEINVRLELPNDFLFKVDMASMRESLEVRVPMLDEDLFAFGLSLPHNLKVKGRTGKVVLRELARRRLPQDVVKKPKHGFGIPFDKWVGADFKRLLKDTVLDPGSKLPEYLSPQAYRPLIEAFCEGRSFPGIPRSGLYRRAVMLLSLNLSLCRKQ